MCVIDFIFWSFTNDQLRDDFTNHITQVPSIWKTFITIGPSSKVFNLGLFILSLNYWKTEKLGVGILFLASLILWHVIPTPHRLIFGYSFTLIAFGIILFGKDIKNMLQKRA